MTKNLDDIGLKSVADHFDLFFVDLWGVVHNGIELYKDSTEALEKLWNGPEIAKQMGKKGRKRVVKLFSWEKVAEDIEKIFYDVTSKKLIRDLWLQVHDYNK